MVDWVVGAVTMFYWVAGAGIVFGYCGIARNVDGVNKMLDILSYFFRYLTGLLEIAY